jgi:hypothetical protein
MKRRESLVASLQDLRNSIDELLGLNATGQLLRLNRNAREKAYEVYIFSLIARSVESLGGSVEIHGMISGPNPPELVFRGGPGQMWSTSDDFCYLVCRLRQKRFEVHVSVTYEGQSAANHEIDVSIIEQAHADKSRRGALFPRTNKNLVGAIECKFYESNPGVVLGRTFVGLLSDCTSNRFQALAANRTSTGLESFLSKVNSPLNFTDLTPLDKKAEERFIGTLAQALKQWSNSR